MPYRRGEDGIETIELDIWTTLNPPWGWSTEEVWEVVAAPDARVWSRTAQFNMPFNVSLVGAVTYLVRTTCGQSRGLAPLPLQEDMRGFMLIAAGTTC